MRRRDFTIGSISAVGLGRGATAEEVLRDRIARGGLVLLLRHARTEPGIGDPPGFRLDDCATQRNLSPEGRADARALGAYLRASGLLRAEVRSSAWCRRRETAELLGLGPVAHEPALDSFFEDRSRAAERTAALRAILAGWPGPATLVLVTHQVNITAATGLATAMGEALLVEPAAGGRILGRLSPSPTGGPPRLQAVGG